MVESFFVQVGRALRSTWAQINGWAVGDKSVGIGNTVNSKETIVYLWFIAEIVSRMV